MALAIPSGSIKTQIQWGVVNNMYLLIASSFTSISYLVGFTVKTEVLPLGKQYKTFPV